MGVVHTDINGETPIPGLYAAGEAACVSLNGANRLGSNSLSECLVFGARAGQVAAQHAADTDFADSASMAKMAQDEQKRIEIQFFGNNGKERVANIRDDLRKTMEEGAGIFRTEDALQTTCDTIRTLKERYENIGIDDHSRVFNTDLVNALELGYMLDVAEGLAHSALLRRESRGSHARSDYEERDDENFLTHSLAYQTDGDPRIEYLPVTLTRWEPEERTY